MVRRVHDVIFSRFFDAPQINPRVDNQGVRLFGYFLALTVATAACLASAGQNCFSEHVQDAIRLYSERAPQYSKMTGGKSDAILGPMILRERVAYWIARYFDFRAQKFQMAGVPVLCDDFVSMATVPQIVGTRTEPGPPLSTYREPANWRTTKVGLGALADVGNFSEAIKVAQTELAILGVEPRFNCLYRHFLESIARVAFHAQRYIETAKIKNLSSPEFLSRQVIKMHLLFFETAVEYDRMAAPLQSDGVPLLCGDVPNIPME